MKIKVMKIMFKLCEEDRLKQIYSMVEKSVEDDNKWQYNFKINWV
ncbi:hypothetical protein [Fusobacterium sp.]|nr:hypothetical protein [Fusobacterium sp.]